jgi:hypothetical protein
MTVRRLRIRLTVAAVRMAIFLALLTMTAIDEIRLFARYPHAGIYNRT